MKEISDTLATEMYKILHNVSPEIMEDIFKIKTNHYNTLNALIFSKRNVKTARYGLQTISYMGPTIWDLVPKKMKQVTTLNEFKVKVRILMLETVLKDSPEFIFHKLH